MARSIRYVSLCALLALACSPALAVAPRTAPAPPPPPVQRPPGEARLLPRFEDPWIAEERDGVRALVMGAARVEISGGTMRRAEHLFGDRIDAATPLGDGRWVFHCRDGTVARSEGFLGPLTRLGAIPVALAYRLPMRGRAAWVDRHGDAWSTDGAAPVERVAGLPRGQLLAIAFSDREHGAAVLEGGAVVRTDDGGARWSPVAMGDEAAWSVQLAGDHLTVATSAGARALAVDGALREAPATELAPPIRPLTRAEIEALLEPLVHTFPEVLQIERAARRRDGAVALEIEGSVYLFDERTGALVQRAPDALPRGCYIRAWGPSLGAVCFHDGAVLRSDDARTFARVGTVREPTDVVFSDDGVHAAARGDCGESPAGNNNDGAGLCALDGEHAGFRFLAGVDGDARPMALRGATLLVRSVRAGGARLALVDLASGESRPVRFSDEASQPRGDGVAPETDASRALEAPRFAPDGTLFGVLEDDRAESGVRFAIGAPDEALSVRALPPGARSVGFADADHGVAAGQSAAQLWYTGDGGERWTEIPVRVDGVAANVRFGSTLQVSCREDVCQVGDRVLVRGLERVAAVGTAVLASEVPSVDAAFSVDGPPAVDAVSLAAPLACELARARPHAQAPAHAEAPAPRDAPRVVDVAGSGGAATLTLTRTAAGEAHAQLRWEGVVAGASIHGQSRVGAWHVAAADAEPRARYRLRALATTGALLERCVDAWPACEGAHEVYWFPAGGAPTLVPTDAMQVPAGGDRLTLEDARALDDGGVALLLAARSGHVMQAALLELGRDARIRARRASTWRWREGLGAAIADVPGALGVALTVHGAPREVRFAPGHAAPASAWPREVVTVPERLPLCEGPRAPASVRVPLRWSLSRASFDLPAGAGPRQTWTHAERWWLELAPAGGACVRAIEAQVSDDRWRTETVPATVLSVPATPVRRGAQTRAFGTSVTTGGERVALRCAAPR